MKKQIFFIILFFLQFALFSQTTHRLFVNQIDMPIDNKGVLADVQVNGGNGGRLNGKIAIYSQGFLLGGYNGNELWVNGVASASRMDDYQPGNVDSSSTNPNYKLYVVDRADGPFHTSWQEWKTAVSLGAEFYDGNNDGLYNPIDLNNNEFHDSNEDAPPFLSRCREIVWCVYNDAVNPSSRRYTNVTPKGIEIRQLVMAFGSSNPSLDVLNYSIITRYQIINTGKVSQSFDSVYFGLWADTDNGDPYDDLAGSDTISQAGYVYNDGPDDDWGSAPPAHFMSLLQGPISYIPGETFIDNNSNNTYEEGIDTPLDSAYQIKSKNLEYVRGAKNLEMSSFFHYQQSAPTLGDPNTTVEAYNYLKGKNQIGQIVDPCTWSLGTVTGVNCNEVNPKFLYSGNPVTNVGWIHNTPNDQRQLISVGPFKLEANKPIEIINGSIIARGTDNLNSITIGKEYAKNLLNLAKNNFNVNITDVKENNTSLPTEFLLEQNYPNPFNPSTTISFAVKDAGLVTLKVYNVLGAEVATLVNEVKEAGMHDISFNASKLSSGVYFYTITSGNFSATKKMILMK